MQDSDDRFFRGYISSPRSNISSSNSGKLLVDVLRDKREVLAWTGSERTTVPQFVMEHQLKTYPLAKLVVHKKRPMALERRLALKEKVFHWLKEGLVRKDEDEREPRFIQAHDPDFVPEPVYPKYIPLEDEHVLSAEEQPLPPVDSPTTEYEAGESSTTRPVGGQGTDYGFVSTVDFEARRQGIRDVGYGIRDTWIDPVEAVPALTPTTIEEVNTRVVELAELYEHDIQDFHALLKDAHDGRSRISQRVNKNSQQLDLLMGDRMTLLETVWTVEEEAYVARTHQTQLPLQSTLIQTQHQVSETRFQIQQTAMAKLRKTDHERQVQLTETLRVVRDMRWEMSDMQKELISQREQLRRERQPGPDARFPDHQEVTRDTDSHP
nr:hypothetical protein [Tanacetum cinerariifolium]